MFSHLVESDLHTGELRRRGTFFLATLTAYALLLMAASVVGVAAYEARIEDQNLELVALVPPETNGPKKEEERRPRATTEVRTATPATAGQRPTGGLIKNVPTNVSADLTKIAGAAQAATTQTPPIVSDGNDRTYDPGPSNPFGLNRGGDGSSSDKGDGDEGRSLKEGPPPIAKKPETNEKKIVYIGPVNSRALSLPQPTYPQLAKAANVEGLVTVEIVIDETGRVASAHATNGHPLLRQEAERAAFRARFSPTLLSEQPVKAKGIITFNFILRK